MTLNEVKAGEFFRVLYAYGDTVFLKLRQSEWPVLEEYTGAIVYLPSTSLLRVYQEFDTLYWHRPEVVQVVLVNVEDL